MSNPPMSSKPQDLVTLRPPTSEANLSNPNINTEPVNNNNINTQTGTANVVAPADGNINIAPSLPPPAYIQPPECRSSRLYDFDDLNSRTSHHHHDRDVEGDDLERAQPPPPYTGPAAREPTIILLSGFPHPGDAAAVSHYPTMDSYIKRSKRMKLYGAVTLAALIVIGIVLLGTLIARQQLGSGVEESDRLG
ncbi:hypothetical protein AA313_de0205525 [Arthrobotrys entomopaga]|nr:hypothetical protein AA313_de0205525 [Arthrobotrys entomopaga]